MCFSAAANFIGSGALAGIGVVTLTKVKHRRELLFAMLPTLFAVHQFIEGFVWLGLDGILSPTVTHNMGAAFMLYAQGLLPFLLPLSVFLFEPDSKCRKRMLPFLAVGGMDPVEEGTELGGELACFRLGRVVRHTARLTTQDDGQN